jgi:hypothetical protein
MYCVRREKENAALQAALEQLVNYQNVFRLC